MNSPNWFALVAVLASNCIGADAVAGSPMRCAVTERSPGGGVVNVYTDETPAPSWAPFLRNPQISWRPPPAPNSPRLVLGYATATMAEMGDPSGGHITFGLEPPSGEDDTQVILSLPGGESVTLQGRDLGYGFDYENDDASRPVMAVAFNQRTWPKIEPAIVEGKALVVELLRHGHMLAKVEFDFSNRAARDSLLDLARRKVALADPEVCTNAPRPAVRMNY